MNRTVAIAVPLLALATTARAELPKTSAELATLYDALRAPTILGSVPTPPKLTVGRAEIRPGAGARTFVLGAGDVPCAVVLDGPATLVYRVEDRFSIPIAERNLRKAHGIDAERVGDALAITANLEGAAVWGWDLDLGEPTPAQPGSPTPPEWLREILDGKLTDNPERDMLLATANGEPEYRWATFHGTGDDFYLDVDGRPAVRTESLARFDKLAVGSGPYSGRLASEELSTQPIGREWLDGTPMELLAVDTDVEARSQARKHLEVTTRTKLQLARDGISLLHLVLWNEVWDDDQRRHDYAISRLLVNGEPAPYLHRWDSLYVRLPEPSKGGQLVELEVTSAGDVLEQPEGDSYWRLWRGWFPQPSRQLAEMAELRYSIDVPAPWIPFAPGEVIERSSADGRNRIRTRLRGPMNIASSVLAGKYSTVTEEQDGARVHVSTYASVKKDEAVRLARIVLAIRGCLERWLGVPYPFQDLQVIEINQWGWGQAPAGLIFVTKEAFLTPARVKLDEIAEQYGDLLTRGVNERVAHEVAHGWFPHVAKIASVEENWLSESLADYTSAYCLVHTMDKRQAKHHWKRQLDQWKYWSKQAGDDGSVFLASHLAGDEKDARKWRFLLYGRGPLVLQAVREKLEKKYGEEKGEQMFLTWIRSYVRTFEFKYAETRHLIGILDQITGEKWTPFFERYLLGTESPEVD